MSTIIPLDWYSNEEIFLLEKKIFDEMPRYCGHESMVPSKNDFYTLEATNHTNMLVRNENGIEVISNVCRHRQAIMRQGSGNQQYIFCPVHSWKYDAQGTLVNAPGFNANPCLNLKKIKHSVWNGLIFEGTYNVADDFNSHYLNHIMDFSSYAFDSSVTMTCNYNWKIFINTYLEIYHVKIVHPGLRNFINCEEVRWDFGSNFSAQTVKMNPLWKKKAGTPIYETLQNMLCEHTKGKDPDYGVVWMMYYPNLMIEHYPYAIVVSQVVPQSPNHCINIVEFYFPTEMMLSNHAYCKAFKDAYLETVLEDDVICEKIHEGAKKVSANGNEEAGPFQRPLEGGISHFQSLICKSLGKI